MESMITDLTDAGWVRVGPYSPYWKAPDDTGPVGRKWTERAAHAEMTARQKTKKRTPRAAAPAADETPPEPAKRGPGRPRKNPLPAPDGDV